MSGWVRSIFALWVSLFVSTAWAEGLDAEDPWTQTPVQTTTEPVAEPVEEAANTEDGESYESEESSGRIEDGRNFVWAAYGLTWAVLLIYGLLVFVRSRRRPQESS